MEVKILTFKKNGSKPGRTLTQFNRKLIENELGAESLHDYCVVIDSQAKAGNHYHHQKREAFAVLSGKLEVTIADPNNLDDRKVVKLIIDGRVVIIPQGMAHAVKNCGTDLAVLWVFATQPARVAEDDIECIVL